MMLVEETPVPDAALPVVDLRAHLRLGTGFGEDTVQDGLLEGFLRAAIAAIEARTGRILIRRAFAWTAGQWRDAGGQALPVAPVAEVSEVTISDRFGTEVLVAPTAWRLAEDAVRPRLMPQGAFLPVIPAGGQVRIRMVAGFGPDWADVPADLRQSVMMLAAHYHEFRHETALGPGCMPFGVTSLIERYRPIRVLGGGSA